MSYVFNTVLAIALGVGAGLCALGMVSTQVYYAAVLYMLYASVSSFIRVFLSVARAASSQGDPAIVDDDPA